MPGAILVGTWYFYLLSFLHEGVHWNLARSAKINDMICNVSTSWMIGVSLKAYRKRHFEHHRSLGTIHDTETTYFLALNLAALFKGVLGVRALEALLSHVTHAGERAPRARGFAARQVEPAVVGGLIAGIIVHGLIVGGLWMQGWTTAALAWIVGVGMVMPLLNTYRQVLEHRSPEARPHVDYSETDQGACTRMFGNGWFDRIFGPARCQPPPRAPLGAASFLYAAG